jgi:hypothetical protein
MKKHSSKQLLQHVNVKKILFDQQFGLPDNFESKLRNLEEQFIIGIFDAEMVKDLIGLYTVKIIFSYFLL